ncbi:MAG: hypothetical protein ACR2JT_01725, partial [Nocardioidaceae bacterium]
DAADVAAGINGRLRGRTTSTELGLALGVAPLTAASRVATAEVAVKDHPRLLDLLGSGRVSMGGLRLVLKATDVLHPDQRRTVAAQLAHDAERDRLTPGMLERAALRRVIDVDPDAAEKRARASRNDRRISAVNQVDGTGVLWAKLRAEELTLVYGALDSRARCLRGEGDERSITDLMCDLLIEAVTGLPMKRSAGGIPAVTATALSNADPPDPDPDPWDPADVSVPDPYPESWQPPGALIGHPPLPSPPRWRIPAKVEVQVVISAATLLGLDDAPCLLRGYGTIPGEVARDIVDNATSTTLRGLFADPVDGRLLAMESSARCFEGGLRQFDLYRDQRCRLSGGRIRAIDHVKEVQDGGPTSAGNGQGLAKNPHVVKDHPEVTVNVDTGPLLGDDLDTLRENAPNVTWTMPTGHSYQLPPPPTLGEGSRPTTIQGPPPPVREPESLADLVRTLTAAIDQRPLRTSKPRRRGQAVQRRNQRRRRRRDRGYTREDQAVHRDTDDTRRRQARQARDRRRQRRERQPT